MVKATTPASTRTVRRRCGAPRIIRVSACTGISEIGPSPGRPRQRTIVTARSDTRTSTREPSANPPKRRTGADDSSFESLPVTGGQRTEPHGEALRRRPTHPASCDPVSRIAGWGVRYLEAPGWFFAPGTGNRRYTVARWTPSAWASDTESMPAERQDSTAAATASSSSCCAATSPRNSSSRAAGESRLVTARFLTAHSSPLCNSGYWDQEGPAAPWRRPLAGPPPRPPLTRSVPTRQPEPHEPDPS